MKSEHSDNLLGTLGSSIFLFDELDITSIESYIESFVSVYEHHFYSCRNLAEDTMNHEFVIAQNGPSIYDCDRVLVKALNKYFDSTTWKELITRKISFLLCDLILI